MDNPILPPILFGLGALAGLLANRLPLSNVFAFVLAMVPVAGFGLAMVFC